MTFNEMIQLVPEEDRDKEMLFLDVYTGRHAFIGIERVDKEHILCVTDGAPPICKRCPHLEASNENDPAYIAYKESCNKSE